MGFKPGLPNQNLCFFHHTKQYFIDLERKGIYRLKIFLSYFTCLRAFIFLERVFMNDLFCKMQGKGKAIETGEFRGCN
jgi:hypothetical protein